MTGEIVIRSGELPEGLPEGAEAMAFQIHGDAEMEGLERIAIVYQLALTLKFSGLDWEMLRMMADHEPPFDEMISEEYSIGYTGWKEEDDEQDD